MSDPARSPVVSLSAQDGDAASVGPRRSARVDEGHLASQRLITPGARKDLVNAYNTVRANVLRSLAGSGRRIVTVMSPVSGDGKSVTASNLAISLARDIGRRALLVDFDLHRPSIAALFGLQVESGVDDYLAGNAGVEDVLIDLDVDGLQVMPVRRPRQRASELVAGDRAARLLAQLEQEDERRVVVVDLPPLLATPDARASLERCGTALLVVRDGATPADMLRRAVDMLEGYTIAGVVLNDSADRSNTYYDY